MIRLTWLQFRTQALVGAAALAVVGTVVAITGPSLHHLYAAALDCHTTAAEQRITTSESSNIGHCSATVSTFLISDHSLQVMLNVLVEVVPALVGLSAAPNHRGS